MSLSSNKKKLDFDPKEFDFKVVKLDAYSGDYLRPNNKLTFYILVDEQNFVHDFKVVFHKAQITRFTTPAHKQHKQTRLEYRKQILAILAIEHSLEEQNGRKPYIDLSALQLEKLNKFIYNTPMHEITFRNVEYLLIGSNPSGQGHGKGMLKTRYQDEEYLYGFFFQVLQQSKKIKSYYDNVDYQDIWKELFNNDNYDSKCIMFDKWINSDSLLRNKFIDFKLAPRNWEAIKKEFENQMKSRITKWNNIISIINKQRSIYRKGIEDILSAYHSEYPKTELSKEYFDLNTNTSVIEFAHIKPVYAIKEEYLKTSDTTVLDQISDCNNFLPLTPNIHTLYDKNYFYWNEDGNITLLKDINESELLGYTKIKPNRLNKVIKYIKDYIKIIYRG